MLQWDKIVLTTRAYGCPKRLCHKSNNVGDSLLEDSTSVVLIDETFTLEELCTLTEGTYTTEEYVEGEKCEDCKVHLSEDSFLEGRG